MIKHPTYQLSLTQTTPAVRPPLKHFHSWLPELHTLLVFFLPHWFFHLLRVPPHLPDFLLLECTRAQYSDLFSASFTFSIGYGTASKLHRYLGHSHYPSKDLNLQWHRFASIPCHRGRLQNMVSPGPAVPSWVPAPPDVLPYINIRAQCTGHDADANRKARNGKLVVGKGKWCTNTKPKTKHGKPAIIRQAWRNC